MQRVLVIGLMGCLAGCGGTPSAEDDVTLGSGGAGAVSTGGAALMPTGGAASGGFVAGSSGGDAVGDTGGSMVNASGGRSTGGTVASGGEVAVTGGVPAGSTGGGLGSTGGTSEVGESAFPSVDGKWAEAGPFQVTETQDGPDHTLVYPTDLGRDGLRHPVILWGNGTGVTPAAYAALLRHWASHGFIVAAANTTWAGTGAEMIAGATWLADENAREGSPFFGKVDLTKVGATGHSQGGGGAIAAGADPIVITTLPIQPGPQGSIAALHGPMFIIGGAADTIVNPDLLVEPRYQDAAHIEAVYGLLAGAGHFVPAGNAGAMRSYMTAWFRLHLMGDETARGEFYGAGCGLCADPDWTVQRNYE